MMNRFRFGFFTGPLLGGAWMVIVALSIAVTMSFATGQAFAPDLGWSLIWGAVTGFVLVLRQNQFTLAGLVLSVFALSLLPYGPLSIGSNVLLISASIASLLVALSHALPLFFILRGLQFGALNRHEFETAIIRMLMCFGYVFFSVIVLIPFYVMVMTSLKSQSELLQNPLDFSLNLSKGWGLFRSYHELFTDFNFGEYLWTSFYVSVLTVLITLAFSIPGAYSVARLRFRGRSTFSRSILLIYMIPMIVLALPIYIAFSKIGLRNSITGIVLIYPVTTIPVALYMLQGYFRGIPSEVEEAGLMDGLNRLAVIWKITLPLSLPAIASVSLYVFMIAWNEFLLAFMLLDDPSKFTLTRGIASLNSSEIPRQHVMAGSVIATLPIIVLFLGLERFMTKGLTAGSVKG